MQRTLQHLYDLRSFLWFAFAREDEFPLLAASEHGNNEFLPAKDREEGLVALQCPEVTVRVEPDVP